jgi:hypothetical protein
MQVNPIFMLKALSNVDIVVLHKVVFGLVSSVLAEDFSLSVTADFCRFSFEEEARLASDCNS